MIFKISAAATVVWLCVFTAAAGAEPVETNLRLAPLDVVLLAAPSGFKAAVSGADPRLLTVGPLSPPDLADVLGVVLPEPIAPWSPGSPPPTMADVISVVNIANWNPYNPLDPDGDWGWGAQTGVIAEASMAWRAQMAAYQAQSAQSNAQQINAFSGAIQAQFDIAMDPNRSPFDGLVASDLAQDGGLLTTEFHWGRSDPSHVERVFVKIRESHPGFFGE